MQDLWRLPAEDLPLPAHEIDRNLEKSVRRLVRWSDGDVTSIVAHDGDDPRAVALARAIVGTAAYQAAAASPICLHEIDLLGTVAGELVSVTADLVCRDAGGSVVIGYDLGTGEPAPDRDATTRRRARDLALAFQAATGDLPRAVEIIHAASGAVSRFESPAEQRT